MLRRLIATIGADRHLTLDELELDARVAVARPAWDAYQSHFDGFTGARLDPQFDRLDHPARHAGIPRVSAGTAVVIVGAGPSLAHTALDLTRVRDRISIWTSARSAEALAAHRLTPDLVLVQHETDLDAYLSVRHLRDRNGANPLDSAPQVMAEAKTPAALVARVPVGRLSMFDGSSGWGLWPASLAWLAFGSGATLVALAGIDLGQPHRPDPTQEPLRAVLSLLASCAGVVTVDAGGGAPKPGWPRATVRDVVGNRGARTVRMERQSDPGRSHRLDALDRDLARLRDTLDAATAFRSAALAARDSRAARRSDGRLADAWRELRDWRHAPTVRVALQECLGVRFLPRFWREASDTVRGPLWRPVLLATDEIVRQATRARERLSTALESRSA